MKIDLTPSRITPLLLAAWLCANCHAQLLPQPRFLWSINLDETNQWHALKKGNGVVASQDGTHIFATVSNGSLHALNSRNLSTSIFQPSSATVDTECSSKPVLVFDGTSNAYVIYSVVEGTQSTVYGVNFDGSLKWKVTVDGKIMGTPVVSNNAIYVSHNVDSTTGYLSVLLFEGENNSDHRKAPTLTASLAPTRGTAPLGPPSLDVQHGQDVVAVAEWWDGGYGTQGNLYLLVFSEEYDRLGGIGNNSYEMQHVSSWPFSAATSPLMVSSSLWLGASGAHIGGWQQKDVSKVLAGQKENIDPKWSLQLDTKRDDAGQPFLTAPVISDDASILVLAGTNGELYGLQSKDGRQQWTYRNGKSAILAKPLIVDDVLYVIESQNGSVRQHSLWGGDEIWQIDCDSEIQMCANPVEADFAISPNGALLYYGDVSGNIVALQIGVVDTAAPTMVPTAEAPTKRPSSTSAPTQIQNAPTIGNWQDGDSGGISEDSVTELGGNVAENEDSDSRILIIGCAVGAFILLIAIVALLICRRKLRRKNKDCENKKLSSDYGYPKTPRPVASSRRELDYGTPDKKAPISPPKEDTPDTSYGFDSDSEVGIANNQRLPGSNYSTRDLTDTFSLVAPSETDDATLTNNDGMPSDASHMSEESDLLVVSPPAGPIPKQVQTETSSCLQADEEKDDEENSVDELHLQSQAPVSPTSTVSESSVYTGQPSNSGSPGNSFSNLMPAAQTHVPILPDVFASNRGALANHEARMVPNQKQSRLSQLAKHHPYQLNHSLENDDDTSLDLERNVGPGAHYMSKSPQETTLFNPVAVQRDNSIDGSGAKFGASRHTMSSLDIAQGEVYPKKQNTEKWENFMNELEEAEKMFSEPNLKSSNFLSEDDESTDADSSFMGLVNSSMRNMLGSDRGI